MRRISYAGVGLALWLLLPGCGGSPGTVDIEQPHGSGGTGGDGGTDQPSAEDADADNESDAVEDVEPEGRWKCGEYHTAIEKETGLPWHCGFYRCTPGIGCEGFGVGCENDDVCIDTLRDIGWDSDKPVYCKEGDCGYDTQSIGSGWDDDDGPIP